jgi:imidazolonepropionase-like amidohydrolase
MTVTALGTDLLIISANHVPVHDGVVLTEAGRVLWAGPRTDMPSFEGAWLSWRPAVLVPGLIDSHSHLSIETPGDEAAQLQRPDREIALRASSFASTNLASGVVGMRLLGEPRGLDRCYLDASGNTPGSWAQMISAGPGIRPSHATVSVADAIVDTSDDARAWIDRIASQDSYWIKIHCTPSSLHGDPTESLYSPSLLRFLIRAGHQANLRVAVHCHGGVAADVCIEEGVSTIEHGRFLSDEQLKSMAATGITLVSTVAIGALARHRRTGEPLPGLVNEFSAPVQRAQEAGVQVIPGTDAVHGGMHIELSALCFAGFTPQEAFAQATIGASQVCGFPLLGSLEKGKLASAIGLSDSPLESVDVWQRPSGRLHGQQITLAATAG